MVARRARFRGVVPLDIVCSEWQSRRSRFSNEPPPRERARCAVTADDLLQIQLTHLDGVAVLTIRGEIDAHTAPRLRESVERGCELGVPVVLDMERVTFMDSSGIAALIAASGMANGHPGSIQIQRPSDQVRRVLTLTGLATTLLSDPKFALTREVALPCLSAGDRELLSADSRQ